MTEDADAEKTDGPDKAGPEDAVLDKASVPGCTDPEEDASEDAVPGTGIVPGMTVEMVDPDKADSAKVVLVDAVATGKISVSGMAVLIEADPNNVDPDEAILGNAPVLIAVEFVEFVRSSISRITSDV